MEALIQEITALGQELSVQEQQSALDKLTGYLGKPAGLTPESLALLEHHELTIVRDTLSGLVLTQNAAPRFRGRRLEKADADAPRIISLGRIAHPFMPQSASGSDPAGVQGNLLERQGIRSIFFDVDDTLYSQFDLTCDALRAVLALPENFPFREAYRRIGYYSEKLSADGDLLQASPQGERAAMMREERFIRGLSDYGVQADREQGAQIQKEYTRLQGEMRMNKGADELLASLTEHGIITGIITNGNEEHQRSKLRTLGLSRYVPEERTFISGKAGFTKPDPRIFHLANKRTGTQAEGSLYVGDSWAKDMAGASAAGWQTVWFNPLQDKPGAGKKPAAVVRTFAELRELLGLHSNSA